MTIIKAFSSILFRLRNNEHFTLMFNVVKFVTEHEASLPMAVVPLWRAFIKEFERENDIFKRKAMALETKYIVEANRRRGDGFMFIHLMVKAASYSRDAAIREASAKLGEVLHNYKSIQSVAMNEVTALVYNLLKDLGGPRYSDAVKRLGLESAVDTLETANRDFNSLYIKRAQGREASAMQGTMRDVRPVVNKAFKRFTDALGILCKAGKLAGTGEQDAYMPVIVFINGLIDQYGLTLARRRAGAALGKDKKDVAGGKAGAPGVGKVVLPSHAMSEEGLALVTDIYRGDGGGPKGLRQGARAYPRTPLAWNDGLRPARRHGKKSYL
ncbi:MAG: DUF6261 family protein [Tannerellaceae bacterium]|jgi:hypothetical protein|nr:DUF6261 family protein [Tannerellaceae bacterium]